MKKYLSLVFVLFYCLHLAAQKLKPVGMRMAWGERVTPENAWRQYPRPQMVLAEWMNLNGLCFPPLLCGWYLTKDGGNTTRNAL